MSDQKDSSGEVQLPISITWRDIVTIVSIAVTLTLAWGIFGTRLTVAEKEIISIHETLKDQKEINKAHDQKLAASETRVRDLESALEDLWKTVNSNQYSRRTK